MFKRDRNIIIFIALLICRIPLSHIIGDNGMGYLSGPMEVYLCLCMLFGTGMLMTMSSMLKDKFRRQQYKGAGMVYQTAKRFAVPVVIFVLALNIPGYNFISKYVLLDEGQRLAFLFVGPAAALSIINDLYKGFLSATENTAECVIGEIVEALADITAVVICALIGMKYGAGIAALLKNEDVSAMYGAMGAMAGIVIGEFITFLVYTVMVIFYQRSFRHLMASDDSRRNDYYSDIAGRVVPGMLLDGVTALIIQLPVILLIVIFRHCGIKDGMDRLGAMTGVYYSKYLSVTGILAALSVIPVPQGIRGVIAGLNQNEDQYAADRFSRMFGRILYFAIPAVIFLTMLTQAVTEALFTGMTTTVKTVIGSAASVILLYALMYMLIGMLEKMNNRLEVLFMTFISLAVTGIVGFIFMKGSEKGLLFMALLLMGNYGLNCILCLFVLARNMKLKISLMQQVIVPLVVSGIIGLLIKLLSGALLDGVGPVLTCFICLIPAWILYNIVCMFLRCVSASQMEKKLFGHIFVAIGQNMGIY